MPSQISAPIPVTPPRKSFRPYSSTDLFTSLNATLQAKDNQRATPIRTIQERDWDVPAPPPPSPSEAKFRIHIRTLTAVINIEN
ncbi:uncharacterized protein F4807DRAFT_462788 [Annulohypoxylon truncatum]|uniref:uncharacterized protein n=1 Tax=Annulohypoxylon truncatum TaxID=327061 RepID=UPI0020085315|nr:uncharacterized protein F4807DRAFT_462788 [Annulohypoxylon truncatum]KAI1207339.1 hypothetical protein F4807DRAFT_462788 [Annulohypoxylon truncatum]